MKDNLQGKLTINVEYNHLDLVSLSGEANMYDMTNRIEELSMRIDDIMQESLKKKNFTVEMLNTLPKKVLEKYMKTGSDLTIKIYHLESPLIMVKLDNVLLHQIPDAFRKGSISMQRAIEQTTKGIKEDNVVGVRDTKVFDKK